MSLVEEEYRLQALIRKNRGIFKNTVSITYDIYSPKVRDDFLL